ncbi:MAG: DEAD/DEAH box helicase, partial [Candidatus Sumerlaeota bacterium]
MKWLLRHTNPINALRDLLAGRTRYIDDYRSYYFTGPRFIEKIKAFKDEGLAAFLESDLCRDAERDMGDMILASHFKAWFQEENRPQPNAQIEIFFSVGDEKPCPFLYWELVLSTTRLYQSPRHAKAIESLDREVKDGKRVLPDMEERLLRWVSSLPEITDNHSSNNSTTFAVGHIARWLMDWEEFDLIRWRDKKEPVRIDWEPANLYPAPLDSGALEWRLRKPDGSSLPLAEAEIILDGYIMPGTEDKLRTSIYFLEGPTLRPVHTKHMPLTLLQDLKNIGVFSPSAIESPQVTRKLIRHYKLDQQAEFADSKLICHVPAKPQVEIRLTSNSSITVTARAETATGQTFYRDSRGNWLQVAKIEPVGGSMQIDLFDEEVSPELNKTLPLGSEDAEEPDFLGKMPPEKQQRESLLVEPAPECIQAVDEFLESFLKGKAIRTKDDQGYPQLEWDYSQKQLPDLLDSWARRPKSITYLGNRAFQNLLITCKPPRISLSVTESGTDWLRVSVKMEREMEALSMAEVRQALQTSQSDLVILKGNRVYRKEELEQYESTVNRLSELGLDPEGDEQKMHALQLAFAAEDASHELAGMPEDLSLFRERATEIIQNFTGVPPAVLPEKLQSVLRPYQKEGVSFLAWAWENFGGAILADDMGLGKTLQVLTALSSIQSSEDEKLPSLIICPTSVTHNWLREAKNFTPWLSAVVLERGENRKRVLKNLTKWDIVITNYALARRESENLTGQEWRLVCVDEAQAIKNPAANISALVKSLEARFRVALTGTPIENRLTDLWSIADFAVPNYLWTRRSFEKRAKEWDDALLFKNLRARLRPLLMRRLKTEVAKELPPRIEERRDCEMAAGQRKAYLAELKQAREMLKDKDTKLAGKERIIFLAVLTRMRQICCDPALLNLSARKSGKVDAALELLEELLEAGHKVL